VEIPRKCSREHIGEFSAGPEAEEYHRDQLGPCQREETNAICPWGLNESQGVSDPFFHDVFLPDGTSLQAGRRGSFQKDPRGMKNGL